jgi:hypothetical protein
MLITNGRAYETVALDGEDKLPYTFTVQCRVWPNPAGVIQRSLFAGVITVQFKSSHPANVEGKPKPLTSLTIGLAESLFPNPVPTISIISPPYTLSPGKGAPSIDVIVGNPPLFIS